MRRILGAVVLVAGSLAVIAPPAAMAAAPSGASAAPATSAGDGHTCELSASGAVKCWGHGNRGQLGNGSTNDSTIPVAVTGLTSATAVAAYQRPRCALVNR